MGANPERKRRKPWLRITYGQDSTIELDFFTDNIYERDESVTAISIDCTGGKKCTAEEALEDFLNVFKVKLGATQPGAVIDLQT